MSGQHDKSPFPAATTTRKVRNLIAQLQTCTSEEKERLRHQLINESFHRIRRLAARILHESFADLRRYPHNVRTTDVADQAASRVYKLLETIPLNDDRHFFRLLGKNVRWYLLELVRKHNRRKKSGLMTGNQSASPAPAPSLASEVTAEFFGRLEDLEADEQEVVDLSLTLGLPLTFLADLLGLGETDLEDSLCESGAKLLASLQAKFPKAKLELLFETLET